MSAAEYVASDILPAALRLLPPRMDSEKARVMLMAIGLQESQFRYRRQVGGPARGFWQFEEGGGVHGVLNHPAAKPIILPILDTLCYSPEQCYGALEDNDVLACVFARLLMWTSTRPLPEDAPAGWVLYLDAWRPGKPHLETWASNFRRALELAV